MIPRHSPIDPHGNLGDMDGLLAGYLQMGTTLNAINFWYLYAPVNSFTTPNNGYRPSHDDNLFCKVCE